MTFAPWWAPSPDDEQARIAERVSYVIARRGSRGRPCRYVERLYPTREDAAAALADMLSVYPAESRWHTEIVVAEWPARTLRKRGRPRK